MANRRELMDSIVNAVATLEISTPASDVADAEETLNELLAEADNTLWDAIDYITNTHRFANGETGVII